MALINYPFTTALVARDGGYFWNYGNELNLAFVGA